MRSTKLQGTAGYVTRMSGGVEGRGREASSIPIKPQKTSLLMPIRFVYTIGAWSSLGQKRNVQRTSKPMALASRMPEAFLKA